MRGFRNITIQSTENDLTKFNNYTLIKQFCANISSRIGKLIEPAKFNMK